MFSAEGVDNTIFFYYLDGKPIRLGSDVSRDIFSYLSERQLTIYKRVNKCWHFAIMEFLAQQALLRIQKLTLSFPTTPEGEKGKEKLEELINRSIVRIWANPVFKDQIPLRFLGGLTFPSEKFSELIKGNSYLPLISESYHYKFPEKLAAELRIEHMMEIIKNEKVFNFIINNWLNLCDYEAALHVVARSTENWKLMIAAFYYVIQLLTHSKGFNEVVEFVKIGCKIKPNLVIPNKSSITLASFEPFSAPQSLEELENYFGNLDSLRLFLGLKNRLFKSLFITASRSLGLEKTLRSAMRLRISNLVIFEVLVDLASKDNKNLETALNLLPSIQCDENVKINKYKNIFSLAHALGGPHFASKLVPYIPSHIISHVSKWTSRKGS